MTTAFITWSAIVAVMAVLFSIRIIVPLIHVFHGRNLHIFGNISEREMIYVPGDCLEKDGPDYDNNEDFDL